MKNLRFLFLTFLMLLIAFSAWATSPVTSEKQPAINIQEPVYTFSEVLDGKKVVHDFIVKNTGDAVLKIDKVDTTWGCTAASYTKTIPPGGEGKITIHLTTKNKGGQTLSKTVKVRSNDPLNAVLPLTIKGKVEKFADISTTYISFRGAVGDTLEKKLIIKPKKDYPFKIKSVQVQKKQKLDVVWKEVKVDSGAGIRYEFLVKNIQTKPGSCKNRVSINIDSKHKRQIVIYIGGHLSTPKQKPKKN